MLIYKAKTDITDKIKKGTQWKVTSCEKRLNGDVVLARCHISKEIQDKIKNSVLENYDNFSVYVAADNQLCDSHSLTVTENNISEKPNGPYKYTFDSSDPDTNLDVKIVVYAASRDEAFTKARLAAQGDESMLLEVVSIEEAR